MKMLVLTVNIGPLDDEADSEKLRKEFENHISNFPSPGDTEVVDWNDKPEEE